MKTTPFLSPSDEEAVLQAIRDAESRTTGEIRLCVSPGPVADVQKSARQAFDRLGMAQTRDRNAVLVYIAPASRAFAILGDAGIHTVCGDSFWSGIAERLACDFGSGSVVDGLIRAIREIGAIQAKHHPRTAEDTNELSDGIATD